jgi:hypothetical protein
MIKLRALARPGFTIRTAAAVAIAAVIAIVFWPRTPASSPAATPSTAPTPTVVQPLRDPSPETSRPATGSAAAPPLAQLAPLRFPNPFDSSEVFEFPAGTSYVEARDRVAQLLITRARARSEWHDASTHSAPTSPSQAANEASFARQL